MQDDMDSVGYREIPKGALEAYLGELVGYQGYQGGSWEKICEGDFFMLCTDGALENISEEIIKTECIRDKNIEEIINNFASQCEGNTRDNYTLQIIMY